MDGRSRRSVKKSVRLPNMSCRLRLPIRDESTDSLGPDFSTETKINSMGHSRPCPPVCWTGAGSEDFGFFEFLMSFRVAKGAYRFAK